MWLDELVEFACGNLTGERELEALGARGVTDEQIRDFRIGYVDERLPTLQNAKGFLEWSLQGRKLSDMFVFPLTNALGQVKGLQFRHVEREAKGYTDYFLSKDEPAYFGLSMAMPYVWRTQTVCLIEGTFDLFPVQRVFPFAVSTMTASVTTAFHRFLRRNVSKVWLGYDSDSTGRRGAQEFKERHGADFEQVLIPEFPRLKMPGGKRTKDFSDVWEVLGDERFGVYLKSAFGQK
jgi:DNA primase